MTAETKETKTTSRVAAAATNDENPVEAVIEEATKMNRKQIRNVILLSLGTAALGFGGGYFFGSRKANKAASTTGLIENPFGDTEDAAASEV